VRGWTAFAVPTNSTGVVLRANADMNAGSDRAVVAAVVAVTLEVPLVVPAIVPTLPDPDREPVKDDDAHARAPPVPPRVHVRRILAVSPTAPAGCCFHASADAVSQNAPA
jgi:hypothetical protein